MHKRRPRLMSRAQVAEYAEVSRAAVTNWEKRNSDFPEPVDAPNGLFDLNQITEWLSARIVPAKVRHPYEESGTTYADRIQARIHERSLLSRANSASGFAGDHEETEETDARISRILTELQEIGFGAPERHEVCLGLLQESIINEGPWTILRRYAEHQEEPRAILESDSGSFMPQRLLSLLARVPSQVFHRAVMDISCVGSGKSRRENLSVAFDQVLASLEAESSAVLRTPASLVETASGILTFEATPRHIHDPFCRTGEFLMSAQRRLRSDAAMPALLISGAAANVEQANIARMNSDVHGIQAEILEMPVDLDRPPFAPKADLVITNPPFNQRMTTPPNELILPYGSPPKSNANFAWLQYAVSMLNLDGRAGVMMPKNAAFSTNSRESSIRRNMIEDGAVEAVVAFPDRLFAATGISVSLWLLKPPAAQCTEVLFIDGSELGEMVSRTRRALSDEDVGAIQAAYCAWRTGEPEDSAKPGISRAAGIAEIREREYSLHPPSYITATGESIDDEAPERFAELTRRLSALEARIPEIDSRTRHLLEEIDEWMR